MFKKRVISKGPVCPTGTLALAVIALMLSMSRVPEVAFKTAFSVNLSITPSLLPVETYTEYVVSEIGLPTKV